MVNATLNDVDIPGAYGDIEWYHMYSVYQGKPGYGHQHRFPAIKLATGNAAKQIENIPPFTLTLSREEFNWDASGPEELQGVVILTNPFTAGGTVSKTTNLVQEWVLVPKNHNSTLADASSHQNRSCNRI